MCIVDVLANTAVRKAGQHNQRSMPLWRRSSLTESLARPFRRRALKTLRPSTEDMRLRNPCLLRRLRTEGWKVLLLITSELCSLERDGKDNGSNIESQPRRRTFSNEIPNDRMRRAGSKGR